MIALCAACGKPLSTLTETCDRWQVGYPDLRNVRFKRIVADIACGHCFVAKDGVHHCDCPLETCPRCLQTAVNCQCVRTLHYFKRLRSRGAGMALLLAVAALLNTTVCGPTRGSLDRQLAVAQVAAEKATANAALASERARVVAIHEGR